MKRIALIVLVSAMFTGCASSNGNIASGEPSIGAIIACRAGVCSEEVVQWKNTQMLNSAKSQCDSMGFQAGTVPYSQCIQNIVISARQQDASERAARRAASDASHAQFMNDFQQPIQPGAIQSNRKTNYDCRERLGGRIECTGY